MSDRVTLARRAAPAIPLASPLVLAGVLALATALRAAQLGAISLWTDEFFTLAYPHLGWRHLWGAGLRTEPTSPLYYSLIGGLEALFGPAPWAVRLPSLLGSVAAVALAWRLARVLFGSAGSAALAALLLALAPTALLFAQQARAYALQGAALALALLGLAEFVRGRRAGLWLYAAGGTAAMYLHPTSVLALAGLNVAALSAALGRRPLLGGRALALWCGAGLAILLLCLPLVPVFLSPTAAEATSWIPPLDRWSLERTVGDLLAGPAIGRYDALAAEIGVPLLLALLLLPPWRPGRAALTVLLVPAGVFLALLLGISLHRPLLLARTLAWLLVPLCVVLGDVLRRRGTLIAAAAVTLAATAAALHLATGASALEDWPRLFAAVASVQDADPGSDPLLVLAPHTSPGGFLAYAPPLPAPVRLDDGSDVPEVIVMREVDGTEAIPPGSVAQAIAARRRVWLFYRRPEYPWMRRFTAGLPPPDHAVQDEGGSNPALRALAWN